MLKDWALNINCLKESIIAHSYKILVFTYLFIDKETLSNSTENA
jgi:hypothetical protein